MPDKVINTNVEDNNFYADSNCYSSCCQCLGNTKLEHKKMQSTVSWRWHFVRYLSLNNSCQGPSRGKERVITCLFTVAAMKCLNDPSPPWTCRPRHVHQTNPLLWQISALTFKLKVDRLYIHPKNGHSDLNIWTVFHSVTIWPTGENFPQWLWHLDPVYFV